MGADYSVSDIKRQQEDAKKLAAERASATQAASAEEAKKRQATMDGYLSGPGTGMTVSGTPEAISGGMEGLGFGQMLYGQGIGDIGKEASNYSEQLKGRLNQDSISADVMNQNANRRVAQGANKIGMAGATMGGAQEALYRENSATAQAGNQAYKDAALAAVGRNIGAKQQGMSAAYFGGKASGQAGVVTPVASNDSGMCCFIFLEARYGNGMMDEVVRRYRDEHMTIKNRRGYYKLSEVLVPMMRKYKVVKFLTRLLITDPMYLYGKYHYGYNKFGVIFKPVTNFWLKTFEYLGSEHKFIRENGEVC
jgi:hypothetical protein